MQETFDFLTTIRGVAAGVGPTFVSQVVKFPRLRFLENGKGAIDGISVRGEAAPDDTAVSIASVIVSHHDAAIDADTKDDDIAIETDPITLAGSATVADLDSPLDFPRRFSGRVRVGGDVTFSGAGPFSIVVGLRGTRDL